MKKALILLSLVLTGVVAYSGRLFVLASSQSAISTGTVPGAPIYEPITFSCWVRCSTTNNNMAIMTLQTNPTATASTGRRFLGVLGSSGFSGQWTIDCLDAGTRVLGSQIVPGQLYHVAAVFASTTDRRLYVDGTLDGADTDAPSGDPHQGHRLLVGMRFTTAASYGQFFDGVISEVAMWNIELTQAQITAIAKGVDPRAVSSTQPIVYWPMYGNASPEPGWHGISPSLTLSNSPAATNHPIVTQ